MPQLPTSNGVLQYHHAYIINSSLADSHCTIQWCAINFSAQMMHETSSQSRTRLSPRNKFLSPQCSAVKAVTAMRGLLFESSALQLS